MIGRRAGRSLLRASLVIGVVGCGAPSAENGPGVKPNGVDPTHSSVPTGNACMRPGEGEPSTVANASNAGLAALVETRGATAVGQLAFSANGRIQPRGRPTTYWFEYGKTTAYGSKTAVSPLPPKMAAHYSESWNTGLNGWQGGLAGKSLKHVPGGGVAGGHVRYSLPGDLDAAHADGIGANQLIQYMYPSAWDGGVTYAAFGGGDPDMRGARIQAHVRGNGFVQKHSEVVFWLQSTPNLAESYGNESARWSNWAYTGYNLTDALFSGQWQKVDYRLHADTTQWTYAGHSPVTKRETYVYVPLDQVLGHLNGNMFHMLVLFEYSDEPNGTIDVDELEVTYRNRSVLVPSNGGKLLSGPAGGDDPARLLDGWRNGPERTWRSAAAPQAPLEWEFELAQPVTLDAVQLHQNPEWPSKDIEVLVSANGVDYAPLARGVLPQSSPAGPNFAFYLNSPERVLANRTDNIPVLPWLDYPVKRIKVRVLSGYRPEHWGLGEIEVFGKGAVMQTDDEWYSVTADVGGTAPGDVFHYRVVAQTDAGITTGPDLTYTVPAVKKPNVTTCAASRISRASAKVEGRINPLGESTQYYFDYGTDTTYGLRTEERYGGLELTPRTVTDTLPDLTPGTEYHYRVVAFNQTGISYGDDAAFIAK